MENESIFFQPLPEEDGAGSVVRKSFRVPITDKHDVSLTIGEKVCQVVNFSEGGACIITPEALGDYDAETSIRCELRLGHIRLSDLTFKVVHGTLGTSGRMHYGIKWVDPSTAALDAIRATVARIKKELLKDCDRKDTIIKEV